MSFAPPLQSGPADEQDLLLGRHEPSNRLDTFPPTATVTLALDANVPIHVGELVDEDGTAIVVAVNDLINDVNGVKDAIAAAHAHQAGKVIVLAARPANVGDYFRNSVAWAKQVGRASDIHVPSHELAVLLGIEGARGMLRNAYLVITNGAIVWSSAVNAKRHDARHDASGLESALADLAKRAVAETDAK